MNDIYGVNQPTNQPRGNDHAFSSLQIDTAHEAHEVITVNRPMLVLLSWCPQHLQIRELN